MKIQYVIIKVDDQDKALKFYTEILGFVKKEDITGQKMVNRYLKR